MLKVVEHASQKGAVSGMRMEVLVDIDIQNLSKGRIVCFFVIDKQGDGVQNGVISSTIKGFTYALHNFLNMY